MRQVFLVTYDISDDRRRERVFKILRGFGDHMQFSVFRCETSAMELVRLRAALTDAINHGEDQVLFADLGPVEGRGSSAISAIGRGYTHPDRHAIVF
ncbi:MAG: CRISPR-associated endonuclease Cas2 [Planctomycetes bacterium]|nr:CRISPR-associated endonuclease Cas2 [Planctomycetota bacterium]